MHTIYAIYDLTALSIVGGLFVYRHDAAAVRFFSDVASDPQTTVGKHIEDHDLIALAEIDMDAAAIEAPLSQMRHDRLVYRTVITGKAWKAAQETANAEAR